MPEQQHAASLKPSGGKIFAWTLFDFGNTAFSVMMVTFVFPLYFKKIICGDAPFGDGLWGIATSVSMLICAFIAPVLGAASDYSGHRKTYLLAFTLTCIACTALLSFTGAGMIFFAAALFILANIGFEGGIVFYDAYLPGLATPKTYGRISGYGFAMGYLGALTSLIVALPLLSGGFAPENLSNIRLLFLLTAAFFLVFALPLFIFVPDPKVQRTTSLSFIQAGFGEVRSTLRNIRDYPNIARFLLAFFFYNDGVLTIISFAAIFAENTLGFTLQELIIFFITIQTTAIAGSVVFGFISDRIGAKHTIMITLLIWMGVILLAFFTTSKAMFYGVGLLAGISIGSSQSASRSLMTRLTPKDRAAEFFGFYDGLFGKASAVIGPLVFGLMSVLLGSQRFAILSILVFFIAGFFFLARVEVPAAATETAGQP
ncbi:MAG: MFS transporter [Rhizobacter sp.]|nr:MFS transporter [Chlorobiales bacterium]